MSNNIDERIVDMRFNNRQFEDNVQTSIKSLDNLKKGLNLGESAKSLSNLDRVGRAFSLSSIAEGVERISSKFTTLGIIGVTALANITNSVVNTGKQLISSLTVDPIKTGLDEYETKMNAIQTILTNTASKGTKISDVNKTLAELNEYADKTIYNFSEMTRNIGTFTAAGVGLKTSATSIKGIANLAAGSGASALQASTAMYQLSQAIASGSVKLMDWNSVVNAGMGGELFQKALEKTAKELGHGRNMAVSFRESLESGWITTEVLTKTLAKLAADKSLIKAATQVTTFTKLLDTMKESVQSGWAVSWENMIGNKDEAAALFTSINDGFNSIVGASADARNKTLSFWKANGGREAVIEALSNSFKGLQSILKPIGDAFREIFPAMTGQRLVEISKGIRDLTSNFKMGEETSNNLKRTFKGLFALLDIGKQAFMAIAHGLGSLIKYLLPAGDGFLSFTGTIGDFIVSIDEALKKSNAFTVIINKIGDFLKPIANGVRNAIGIIILAFQSLGSADMSGLDSFSERVRVRFEPFTKLGEFIHTIFSKIGAIIKKVAPLFYKLAGLVGDALGKLQTNIADGLDNADFNSIFDIINGGLFAAILLGIKKFIKSLTGITDSAGGFLSGITGILDGVKGSLMAYQSQLKAGTLLKIAMAIGILSASLFVLSTIDSAKLTSALAAITVMFVELMSSMAVFDIVSGGMKFTSMAKLSVAMISLSLAILILSHAMANLAELDWNGIAKGLTAIAALSGILVVSAKLLEKNSASLIRASLGFILFGAAINILVNAVERLGALDPASLAKGLISVGVLAAELSLFMKATDLSGMGVTKGLGFLALAVGISVLAEAVKKFSEIDIGALAKGLGAVAVVLAELAIFVNLTGDSKSVISTALGLTILGAAMLIFASAVAKMGALSWEEIGKGLLTMAGALAIITIAVNNMPKSMILTGTGLVVIATALVILAQALQTMGGLTWDEIARGLTTLAGSLTIIGVAVQLMTSSLAGAAALLIIAGALAILAPVLKIMGSMSLGEIGQGLLALAGIFTVLGVAGLILGPLTPVILGLAAAVALLGVGCLAVGVGMLAFSAGLAALAISGTAGAVALVAVVSAIVGLIPLIFKKLGEGIIELARVIGTGAPILVDAMGKLIMAILNKIIELTPKIVEAAIALVNGFLQVVINCTPKIVEAATILINGFLQVIINTTPKIVEAIFTLLKTLLKEIVDYIPKLVDAGVKIILGFLKGIANNIGKVVKVAVDIIVNFIRAIGKETPRIIDAGFKMVIDFLNGLADSIRTNTPLVNTAIANLITAMIDGFVDTVTSFFGIGVNIINGLIEGVKSMVNGIIDAISGVVNSAIDGAKNLLGIASPSKVFRDEVGVMIGKGMALGIKKSSKEVSDASADMAKGAFDAATEWIDERKYYNKLSLEEELYVWQTALKKFKEGTEEHKKADREVYRLRNELLAKHEDLLKQNYDKSISWIDKQKYYNKLSLEEELAAWERIQKKYLKGTEERINADKEVYSLKNELLKDGYTNSVEWIDKQKYYNKLSLGEELAAWERVQSRYAKGTDEREKADREVYRLKNELVAKQTQIDEEYYTKVSAINEKLKNDIKSVTDEYERAVDARTKALVDSYGLFDKVSEQDPVTGQELVNNLKDQVNAFEDWQKNIHILTKKGMDEGLLQELKDMGPKSLDQIKALNTLSSAELTQYVLLWREKHEQASEQAIEELEGMRVDTEIKIKELNDQASKDLDTYKTTWVTKIAELTKGVKTEFTDLNTDIAKSISTLKTDAQKEFVSVVTTIKKIVAEVDWTAVGTNIVLGIATGIKNNAAKLVVEAATMAKQALQAAKTALGIRSPSKEFENVGMYSVKGLAGGLKKFAGLAVTEAKNVGSKTINSLSGAMSTIAEVVSGDLDMVPTIRPVLDLSNVRAGTRDLASIFSNGQTLAANVRANDIANTISRNRDERTSSSEAVSKISKEPTIIKNEFSIASLVVRGEGDVKKVARQLYQLQITGSRG